MKILSAQGHFGVMDGRRIAFADGLNVLRLPNEGGKTTLCDFIRVMLYGLNTSRRDGKQQLSDKTKYRPADGQPMSGLLELEWHGRRIILSRQTGKGGPMQEFSARDADTGEEIPELTSRECGETLTGAGEEAFRSSAMVDGLNQAVSAEELSDRILALSTTGDSAMMYSRAVEQLDRWKSSLKGGSSGRLAKVEAEQREVEQNLGRYDELQEEIRDYEARIPEAELHVREKDSEYRDIYEKFMILFAGKREEAERSERRAREEAAAVRETLPDLKKLKAAENAMQAYEDSVEEYRRALDEAADITENYENYRKKIDQSEKEYDKSDWDVSDIQIRGWSFFAAIAMVILAVITFLPFFPLGGAAGAALPYIFSIAAVAFLIYSYVNSSRTGAGGPPMDFDRERKKLEKRLARADSLPDDAAAAVGEAEKKLAAAARELDISGEEPEEIMEAIRAQLAVREDYLNRKQRHEELSEQYLDILDATGPAGGERLRMNRAKEELEKAREALDSLKQSAAMCRGRREEIGSREELLKHRQELQDAHADILWNLDAIAKARQSLVRVNAELTGRMAPQINQLAQEYMQTLTADKYTAIQLYTNFEAVCRAENSAVELDRLRLSSGTRDQLYLALRLAACSVLLDSKYEKVPLILDDPFITYDDERNACAMRLLRQLAYERQIILLTGRKPAE